MSRACGKDGPVGRAYRKEGHSVSCARIDAGALSFFFSWLHVGARTTYEPMSKDVPTRCGP